ncbi:MAG: 4Fe-4S binding protein [Planctomycetota bacterium]
MRNAVRYAFTIILSLLLGAHFLRWGNAGLALTCTAFPVLLAFRRRWCSHVLSLFLLSGAVVWFRLTDLLVARRIAMEAPWGRLALILGGISLTCVVGAVLLHTSRARAHFSRGLETAWAATAAFVLVFAVCGSLQARLRDPVPLLLERFWPDYGWYWLHVYAPRLLRSSPAALQPGHGWGWLQVFGLAVYAAFLTDWLVAHRSTETLRSRVWLMFSGVFFAQLILGLLGAEEFLMTGKLHLPVPAVILAGPLYRGEGFFMLILFLCTILIVGPAWCSWLCYIGAWDNSAASARRPRKARHYAAVRAGLFVLVLATAFTLRRLGVGAVEATALGGAFGIVGVGVMVVASRRLGFMVHCTSYCPIGLAADVLGRLNPFRVRIGHGCDECRACTGSCRYAALGIEHIRRRRPGITCTLCGDCLAACDKNQIHYRFPELTAEQARTVFLVLVAALHAIFLGVARL